MSNNLTAIYYSASQSPEPFASKIRQRIQSLLGDMPLISVTQAPLPDFGENICVGDVGMSQHNCKRQIEIGCEEADTEWVLMLEDDFYYQQDYFDPPVSAHSDHNTLLWYQPVYLLWPRKGGFRHKWRSEGALVMRRDFALAEFDRIFKHKPLWRQEMEQHKYEKPWPFPKHLRCSCYYQGAPVITLKLGGSMHHSHGFGEECPNLLGIGSTQDFMALFHE